MNYFKRVAIILGLFLAVGCGDDSEKEILDTFNPWGPTMKGNNQSIQAFPDMDANYWEYTFSVINNPNVGLKIEGEYPDCRFFNFTIYDDLKDPNTPEDQDLASFEDINIKPNSNSVNPFQQVSDDKNHYTIYVVPEGTTVQGENVKNVMYFPKKIVNLSMFLRQYIGIGEFGGVELPKITAFNTTSGERIELPKREISKIHDLNLLPGGAFPRTEKMVFFRAPFSMYYPNRPCQYLYTRNQVTRDSILVLNFRTPSHPKSVNDYKNVDVRYWSICIGDQATYSYQSTYDAKALHNTPGEFTTFVIADKSSAKFDEIKTKCEQEGINFMEWDMDAMTPDNKRRGEGIMILYRNTCIRDDYEHSFTKIEPVGAGVAINPLKHIAHLIIKDYGTLGLRLDDEKFLEMTREQVNAAIRK